MTLVVHTVASLAPESGGPSRTVTSLTNRLANDENTSIILVTQRRTGAAVIGAGNSTNVNRYIADSQFSLILAAGLPFKRQLKDVIRTHRPALIHDHGIWHPTNHHTARAARKFEIPLLIHTRGMLEPWALEYHSRRKSLALGIYQRRDLESAKLFFATASQEVESIRRCGLKQPVALIPNGVEFKGPINMGALSQVMQASSSKRNAVFMSRIHPKKGLLNLIEAWGHVSSEHWCLQLAGPDEGGHLSEVMGKVKQLGLEASIEYVGEVEGEDKAALLKSAELFILPSFSENFGVVVAEAMAYGVPVITTHGTPWEGLVHHDCGWWVEPTIGALTDTLLEALGKAPTVLQAMGDRGRKYVREFNWPHIASQTAEVYRWVLGSEGVPACVVFD